MNVTPTKGDIERLAVAQVMEATLIDMENLF